MGLGVVLSQLSCSSLVFFFVPVHLPLPLIPLRGSAPLPSGLACLSPVCWSTLWCGWRGLVATFSSVPVHCFPCCRYFGIFWASPAPLACWGGWDFAPCVRVFQLRCCLLGLQVGFPCCLFLSLEWVYFWLRTPGANGVRRIGLFRSSGRATVFPFSPVLRSSWFQCTSQATPPPTSRVELLLRRSQPSWSRVPLSWLLRLRDITARYSWFSRLRALGG